jgi:hypothetical protein
MTISSFSALEKEVESGHKGNENIELRKLDNNNER